MGEMKLGETRRINETTTVTLDDMDTYHIRQEDGEGNHELFVFTKRDLEIALSIIS